MKSLDKLKKLNTVCLIGHIQPDADALCSMVVLRDFLMSRFKIKTVDIFADTDEISPNYQDIVRNVELNPTVKDYQAVIMMDSPNSERLGKYQDIFDNASMRLCIDHHDTNQYQGDVNIVKICSSTCEIVFDILKSYKYKLSKANYGMVYAGIITDTVNLTVGARSEHTFEIAGECYENCDADKIYKRFLGSNSMKNMILHSIAVRKIEKYCDGKILFSQITAKDLENIRATDNDILGISNRLSTIDGCQIVCLVTPKGDVYNYGLRAIKGIDVSAVAKANGGGGHKGAAAFLCELDLSEMRDSLLKEFESLLIEDNHEVVF